MKVGICGIFYEVFTERTIGVYFDYYNYSNIE